MSSTIGGRSPSAILEELSRETGLPVAGFFGNENLIFSCYLIGYRDATSHATALLETKMFGRLRPLPLEETVKGASV